MTKNCLLLVSLTFVLSIASAQSPGGVNTNLTLWVKSDANVVTTGGLVDTWGYVNNANTYTSTGGFRPTLVSTVINFNPAIRFTGAPRYMEGPVGVNAPIQALDDDYTIFTVWRSNTVTKFQRLFSQRSPGSYVSADAFTLSTWDNGQYGDEAAIPPFVTPYHTTPVNYTTDHWNISQLNLLNQATGDLEIIDDRNISTGIVTVNTDPSGTPDGAALRALATALHRIGAGDDFSLNTQDFDGDMAEIIIFDRPISGAERNSVFSYLALKYGITTKTNLVSSSATVIWDAATNSAYNNSVFGLGLDNGSGLSVVQSNSAENGSGNGAGQTGEANIVLSSPSALGDQDFLIIGNDNGALTESSTELPVGAAGSFRLAREWKVQHSGNVGTLSASFDLNGLTITGLSATDFRLMVDQDGNGDFTNGATRYYIPVSYTGGVVSFTGLTLNNNEVFALITSAAGTLPVTWVSFSAKMVNSNIQLDWKVANNELAKEFQVEHSTDGLAFNIVSVVANQPAVKTYQYTYPSGNSIMHYFRIRQVDLDGKVSYSKTVSVKKSAFTMSVINNPSRNNTEIEINALKSATGVMKLSSLSGIRIATQPVKVVPGLNRIALPTGKMAIAGTYILTIQLGDIILNEKIVTL